MAPATVRFAPSPTGLLHVGNARVALLNWLFARSRPDGRFLLRIDDTDSERSREDYARAIETDLTWLGLDWDTLARQSSRLDRYADAVATLRAAGRLYPCYETAEELELRRSLQLARGRPPVYDRQALALSADDRARLETEGRNAHWRFKLADADVAWDDMARGPSHFGTGHVSDPVLMRADGTFLYTLPSVVDDIDFAITHVIRGEDHVTNTAVQIQLFEALNATPPAFAHLPLMTGAGGEGLSKRLGSLSLSDLRTQGIEAGALAGYLAGLGSGGPPAPVRSAGDLVAGFDLARVAQAAPRFDEAELLHLNARLLHDAGFADVRDRLGSLLPRTAAPLSPPEPSEVFWLAVRGNLTTLADAADWWTICTGSITPVIEGDAFCRTAADLLPPEPWEATTWGTWTTAVKAATGAKGKALFHPLRLALTGRGDGPDLKSLLPLIGRRRAVARLTGVDG